MIATRNRETVVVEVEPRITAKAATLAAQSGTKTTANIMEEWLIEMADKSEIAHPETLEVKP